MIVPNILQKMTIDNFVLVISEDFFDSQIKIELHESKEKVFDQVPQKIKLNIVSSGDQKFSYSIALDDTTNNTGGCPDNCIKTLFKEKGDIPISNFEKIFDLKDYAKKVSKDYDKYYYNYDLSIHIDGEESNEKNFSYFIDGSYGYFGENCPAQYTIYGGEYVCEDKICRPIDE